MAVFIALMCLIKKFFNELSHCCGNGDECGYKNSDQGRDVESQYKISDTQKEKKAFILPRSSSIASEDLAVMIQGSNDRPPAYHLAIESDAQNLVSFYLCNV